MSDGAVVGIVIVVCIAVAFVAETIKEVFIAKYKSEKEASNETK
jgi:hypothetical protein